RDILKSKVTRMEKVRLGIIGIGNMGSAYARAVVEGKVKGVVLGAICDTNAERGRLFPDVPFFGRTEDIIASNLVDAVIVATPHYDHTTLGIAALKAG